MKYLALTALFLTTYLYASDMSLYEVHGSSPEKALILSNCENGEVVKLNESPRFDKESIIRAYIDVSITPAITEKQIEKILQGMSREQREHFQNTWKPSPEITENTVTLVMTNTATAQFKEYSMDNRGHRLVFVVNGKVFSVPTLVDKLENGIVQVSGNFSIEEMMNIFPQQDSNVFYSDRFLTYAESNK